MTLKQFLLSSVVPRRNATSVVLAPSDERLVGTMLSYRHLASHSSLPRGSRFGSGTLLGADADPSPAHQTALNPSLHWPLSRWFAVLAWTGRKTGRRYSTPVSYVRERTTAYVTTGDRLWRNLTGGAPDAFYAP